MSNNRVPLRSWDGFKIAIVCALPLEATLVSSLFDVQWDTEKYGKEQVDTNAYSLGVFGSHNVALVHMPNMGKVAAATAAAHLRASFPGIQLALVVGICGGAPFGPYGELLLGDVVISEGLVQYDLGRRLPHTFVRKDTVAENLPRPRPEVRAVLAKLQTNQSRNQLQNEMLTHLRLLREQSDLTIPDPGPMNDKLFKPDYRHRHHPPSECPICLDVDGDSPCPSAIEASCEELGCTELDPRPRSRLLQTSNESQPVIHFGLVATGDTVMRSGRDRDIIVARDKVIAFEMEGVGVWETFPAALVIKSVCDYADSHKNKIWQRYAAATAAAAAKVFLYYWTIGEYL
ncbi:nucleoside phosphorylase domain-containing protein [Trichoderma chlorosporum]